MTTIEFTNCIWCEQPITGVPHAGVDLTTSLGRITGYICHECDLHFHEQPSNKEDI